MGEPMGLLCNFFRFFPTFRRDLHFFLFGGNPLVSPYWRAFVVNYNIYANDCLYTFNQFFRLKGYFSKNNTYFCSRN